MKLLNLVFVLWGWFMILQLLPATMAHPIISGAVSVLVFINLVATGFVLRDMLVAFFSWGKHWENLYKEK